MDTTAATSALTASSPWGGGSVDGMDADEQPERRPLGERDPKLAAVMRRVVPQEDRERVAVAAFNSSV